MMKYELQVDGFYVDKFNDLDSALDWIVKALPHHMHYRGVRVFKGSDCVYRGIDFCRR